MTLSVTLRHQLGAFHLDASFDVPDGITALFGKSGSGKTSIVNAIAGLSKPDHGRILLDGKPLLDTEKGINVPRHKRRLGYVFQEGRLFPHFSVRHNLLFGRWFAGKDKTVGKDRGKRADQDDFDRVITLLGLAHLLERRPHGLSGGEKQRVAIGRALLSRPHLLLMDEPLAALDEDRKAEILPYLLALKQEADLPILYVSHSVAEIARLATSVVMLHEGQVARVGPAEALVSDPENMPVIGVREAGAMLPARIVAHHDAEGMSELVVSGGTIWLPRVASPVGATMSLRIHAHDVILATERPHHISALNILPVTITGMRQGSGPGMAVSLTCGTDTLLARITRKSCIALNLQPGLQCYAIIKSTAPARRDVAIATTS